nr:MAG TPA: hypothetical protein [Caudoviricetes sp.]DAR23652.1 MAG TPA: hypothetical protein [Caudoviricetes sp.]DAV46085.1 MAG TPA: hypothetical protein [Caudoviricetes sp.]
MQIEDLRHYISSPLFTAKQVSHIFLRYNTVFCCHCQ